jgi:hypothetical protein
MRERTELMGGRFQARGAAKGGFAIEVDVPDAVGAVSPAPYAVTG